MNTYFYKEKYDINKYLAITNLNPYKIFKISLLAKIILPEL